MEPTLLIDDAAKIEVTETEADEKTTADPYTITEDGHYKGNDDFIVPKDFIEFYSRFPGYVRSFVRYRKWRLLGTVYSIEDCEQSLLIYVMNLPLKSKYREEGFTDRIQTFNPDSSYGASKWRFFNYVNRMLHNEFVQLIRQSIKTPLDNAISTNYDHVEDPGVGESEDETLSGFVNLDEWINQMHHNGTSHHFLDNLYVTKFVDFVSLHNPELVPAVRILLTEAAYTECSQALGMSRALFRRAQRRIKVLYHCYTTGEEVPRQRKIHSRLKMSDAVEDCVLVN